MEDQKKLSARPEMGKRIETVAWGLFFVWVGFAFLMGLSNGLGLLGVGIITLGAQAFRKSNHLKMEGFWLVVGTGFVLGGLWEFMKPDIALVPLLLIIAGVAMLYSVLSSSMAHKKGS